ncbi:LysR family transcriptional regulator [Gordonia soli]|uniref:Putative LysR family transcriptional regulator n=1 Tax=Gordonia soli NBRC 108243 TaxID=1223545 RepID=M0QS67_9ACTN|nr:LysR family transcriptional regulator [Gordonia soli]GAC70917.1 putative LysR family transcriptional regulator [Gordonia soli NBRC 108243]
MRVDPSRLRYLLAVARAGGVLAAADELRVTPSAVSQQLSRLARETGHTLLIRTPEGSVLTPEGLALAEAAQEIERTLSAVQSRLEHGEAELTGPVRIGGFQSFLSVIVAPMLPEWRTALPEVDFRIIESYQDNLMRALRSGELDIAVFELDTDEESSPMPRGMVEQPLLDDPWKLVIPAGTLYSDLSDLVRQNLPLLGELPVAAGTRAAARLRTVLGSDQMTVHAYYTIQTALALIAAGEGMAVMPELALRWVTHAGVETLDVPGLGTRRVVLRSLPKNDRAERVLGVVGGMLRDAISRRALAETPNVSGTHSPGASVHEHRSPVGQSDGRMPESHSKS